MAVSAIAGGGGNAPARRSRPFRGPATRPAPGPPRPANDNWPRPANDNLPKAWRDVARLAARQHPAFRAMQVGRILLDAYQASQAVPEASPSRIVSGDFYFGACLGRPPGALWSGPGTQASCTAAAESNRLNTAWMTGSWPKGATTTLASIRTYNYVRPAPAPTAWYSYRGAYFRNPGAPAVAALPYRIPQTRASRQYHPVSEPALAPLAKGALELGHVQLPGMQQLPSNLSWPRSNAVNAVREAMGLRNEVLPNPATRPNPAVSPKPGLVPGAAILPTPWGSAVQVPGGSIDVRPGQVVPGPSHKFEPPLPGVRERKIKITAAYVAAGAVINAITETGDFVEQIWDALPDEFKTARRTKSGNLRFDRMLKDLFRGWRRIDWDKAAVNLQTNSLEDQIYGTIGLLGQAGMQRAGFGWGASALTGGGQPYGGAGDGSRLGPARDNPISKGLDWYAERRLNAIRAARRAAEEGGRY